jgi:hypothetical protein
VLIQRQDTLVILLHHTIELLLFGFFIRLTEVTEEGIPDRPNYWLIENPREFGLPARHRTSAWCNRMEGRRGGPVRCRVFGDQPSRADGKI